MENAHTPWRITDDSERITDDHIYIVDDNENVVCSVINPWPYDMKDHQRFAKNELPKNAAFICEAVNNHDRLKKQNAELKSALEILLNRAGKIPLRFLKNKELVHYKHSAIADFFEAYQDASAAIASAGDK